MKKFIVSTSMIKRLKEVVEDNIFYAYIKNIRFATLLIISITIFGVSEFVKIPVKLNPEIDIPILLINARYKDGNITEVENNLVIPIEKSLRNISGIKDINSTSTDTFGSITVNLEQSADANEVKTEIESEIDSINFPNSVENLRITKPDFNSISILGVSLYTETNDKNILESTAFRLKDEIEELSDVREVIITGIDTDVLKIELEDNIETELDISINDLIQSISANISNLPLGKVNTETKSINLEISNGSDKLERIKNTVIRVNDQDVTLSEIADVYYSFRNSNNNKYAIVDLEIFEVVGLEIITVKDADISSTSKQAKEIFDNVTSGSSVSYKIVEDSATDIVDQTFELYQSFIFSIMLVFIIIFIFIGVKQAAVISISIPLTLFAAFSTFNYLGISINFLSLFSILLALGLMIDDAIVIVTAATDYFQKLNEEQETTNINYSGAINYAAGYLVFKDFFITIWTTTLTTVWAFIPMLLTAGVTGAFIRSIPLVVSVTLISSTFVAVFIVLPLIIYLLNPTLPKRVKYFVFIILIVVSAFTTSGIFGGRFGLLIGLLLTLIITFLLAKLYSRIKFHNNNNLTKVKNTRFEDRYIIKKLANGFINTKKIEEFYAKLLRKVISNRLISANIVAMVIILFAFAVSLLPLGYVKSTFFPTTDEGFVFIELEFDNSIQKSIAIDEGLEVLEEIKDIEQINQIESVTMNPGTGLPEVGKTGDNIVGLTIKMVSKDSRDLSSTEFQEILDQKFKNRNTEYIFKSALLSGGPPVGSDIEINILGENLEQLGVYSDQLKEILQSNDNIANISSSLDESSGKITFIPDQTKLKDNRISLNQIATYLRLYNNGIELGETESPKSGEDIDIILTADNSLNTMDLNTLNISGVPLNSLGSFNLEYNLNSISRLDERRQATIKASVINNASVTEENAKILDTAKEELNLQSGYSIQVGGANQENDESTSSLISAMFIAAILIFITMILQLRSFRKAFLVILTIPLAVPGIFIIFALFNIKLTFPAIIGILALFGIVVNNGIVLVESINQNLAREQDKLNALVEASTSRLKPIMFSSLTTIVGLIPITITDPIWAGVGGSIISGLMLSGVIMLFFIPALFYLMFYDSIVGN